MGLKGRGLPKNRKSEMTFKVMLSWLSKKPQKRKVIHGYGVFDFSKRERKMIVRLDWKLIFGNVVA